MKHFSPIHHLGHYTRLLLKVLYTPLLTYIVLIGNATLLVAVSLFYYFESGLNPNVTSFWDALWWGLVSVTTVGYGDVVPVTPQGRIIATVLIITGVGLFVGFFGLVVSILFAYTREEYVESEQETLAQYRKIVHELERLSHKIERLEKSSHAPHAESTKT